MCLRVLETPLKSRITPSPGQGNANTAEGTLNKAGLLPFFHLFPRRTIRTTNGMNLDDHEQQSYTNPPSSLTSNEANLSRIGLGPFRLDVPVGYKTGAANPPS
jgi:hypothetical protein